MKQLRFQHNVIFVTCISVLCMSAMHGVAFNKTTTEESVVNSKTRVHAAHLKKDPLLVVALMIKNEAPVIDATLQPMVDAGIDSFLIFDTGSTDDTIEKVHAFLKGHSIKNYVVLQENFVDFATSRNRALDLVDEYFPEALFVMMPDAEWALCEGQALLQFCRDNSADSHASYIVRMVRDGQLVYYVDRLMRRSCHCRFRSPVHEYLVSPSVMAVPDTIYFKWSPTRYGDDKSRKRWQRDVGYLLKAYADDPIDARTAFYLGQTYSCLGEKENALRFYLLKTQLPSFDEENYETLFRIGELIENLTIDDTKKEMQYDWSLALWYYLKAHSMRPTRIEPLIRIANHYLYVGDYASAFLFASRASEIPMPEHEILFVQKDMYTSARYDIMAQAALRLGEYDRALWAARKALEYNPGDKHFLDLLMAGMQAKEGSHDAAV